MVRVPSVYACAPSPPAAEEAAKKQPSVSSAGDTKSVGGSLKSLMSFTKSGDKATPAATTPSALPSLRAALAVEI